MKKMKLPEPKQEELSVCFVENGYCEEFLHDCKKAYEDAGRNPVSPVHLSALQALCAFGEYHGLDCGWIYDAINAEQKSKYETNLKMFYLGAFAEAMKKQGASLNQTKHALKEWAGISTRHVEACHALYTKNTGFQIASPRIVLFEDQVLSMASAVINNINRPYETSYALVYFKKLKTSIQKHGLENETLPFEHDYAEKVR